MGVELEPYCLMKWTVMELKHLCTYQLVYQDFPDQNTVIIVVTLESSVTALVVQVSAVVLQLNNSMTLLKTVI